MNAVQRNGLMDDAGLGPGERLAMLMAMLRADRDGTICITQRQIAQDARVSVMSVGSAFKKMRARGLARRIAAHSASRRRPACWSFKCCAKPGRRS
jgi:hypothetical protein